MQRIWMLRRPILYKGHLLTGFRPFLDFHALPLNNYTEVLGIPVLRGKSLNLSHLLYSLFLC